MGEALRGRPRLRQTGGRGVQGVRQGEHPLHEEGPPRVALPAVLSLRAPRWHRHHAGLARGRDAHHHHPRLRGPGGQRCRTHERGLGRGHYKAREAQVRGARGGGPQGLHGPVVQGADRGALQEDAGRGWHRQDHGDYAEDDQGGAADRGVQAEEGGGARGVEGAPHEAGQAAHKYYLRKVECRAEQAVSAVGGVQQAQHGLRDQLRAVGGGRPLVVRLGFLLPGPGRPEARVR
mmetsp:Transcript_88409/g.234801  ORF Transcript_88409/g.234801 Transcript_88409/m.234801 type:complete len:234 (+) Transcript_88409:1099-1800(+)